VLIVAAILNRRGFTRLAAYLVPIALMLVIAGAVLAAPGGLRLVVLPAYDLFVIPIVLSALIADQWAPWLLALGAISFIVGDFLLQPHALITTTGVYRFDEIAYETRIFDVWGMIDRHVLIAFFAAFIGWLGARSVDAAIARADRAEEIAALEHTIAAQKRALEEGINQILATHVRVANGDLNARAPLARDNVLWQVASALNTLLSRFQQMQRELQQMQRETARLARATLAARAGGPTPPPAPRPDPGTPVARAGEDIGTMTLEEVLALVRGEHSAGSGDQPARPSDPDAPGRRPWPGQDATPWGEGRRP